MIYDRKVTWHNDIRDIDDKGTQLYKLFLKCDECDNIWSTSVYNYKTKKIERPLSLDLCKFCRRKGERNSQYGKDRSEILAHARTFQKINGMSGKHHSPETRALQSKSKVDLIAEGKFDIKSCNRGRKSYYVSTKSHIQFHADSILELARMIELDNDLSVKSWSKYHKIRIPYIYENIQYQYVPDFSIEYISGDKIIEEVKGRIIPRDVEKQNACKIYCSEHGLLYRMFTGKDLKDISKYKALLKETK